MIDFFPIVIVVTLILITYQHLHIKNTVKTWDKKKLSRKNVPLKNIVENYRKLRELFRIMRILMLCVPIAVAMNMWLIFTAPDTAPFPIEFTLSLIPILIFFHLIYKNVCLILERAEELYAQSNGDSGKN